MAPSGRGPLPESTRGALSTCDSAPVLMKRGGDAAELADTAAMDRVPARRWV